MPKKNKAKPKEIETRFVTFECTYKRSRIKDEWWKDVTYFYAKQMILHKLDGEWTPQGMVGILEFDQNSTLPKKCLKPRIMIVENKGSYDEDNPDDEFDFDLFEHLFNIVPKGKK